MTLQEQQFVNAYFLNGGNAVKAATEAGYADPRSHAWRIRQQPEVKAEISRRLDEMAMPANEVLARLSAMGRASMDEFLSVSGRGVRLDITKAFRAGQGHLLKSYKKDKNGVGIEMVDAQQALTTLARYHGLLTDRVINTTDGLDLLRAMLSGLDEEEDPEDRFAEETERVALELGS